MDTQWFTRAVSVYDYPFHPRTRPAGLLEMSLNPRRAESANVDYEAIAREDMAHQRDLPVQKLLLTVPEAGRVLAISRSKVYDLLNSGSLPSVYIGRSRRVRASDVEAFVNGAQ